MNRAAVPLLSVALGAAAGFAGGYFAPCPEAAPVAAPVAGSTAPSADLDRIERRVDELAAAVLSASPKGEASAPAGPAPATPGSGDAPATALADRVAALEARLATLEKSIPGRTAIPEDLSKVSSKDLAELVRNLNTEKRHGDLLRVAEVLVDRTDLDAAQRDEAELQVGYSLRTLGQHADAEARFRKTLARVGESTSQGAWVNFQIAWERSYQKDAAGASALMERAADTAEANVNVKIHSLLRGGQFAREAGDSDRARILLERLLRDHGSAIPATQSWIREQAETALKEMGAR